MLLLAVLVGCAGSGSARAEEARADSLQLKVALDDSVYSYGQAIVAMVCFRNRGLAPFRDVARMDPSWGYLSLRLRDLGHGRDLRRGGLFRDFTLGAEGIRLEPGHVQCEFVNLLDNFAEQAPEEQVLLRALGQSVIPPGRYELSCRFAARSGFNRALKPVWATSDTLRFRVVSEDARPGDAAVRRALTDGVTWRRYRVDSSDVTRCRDLLFQAIPTSHFFNVFNCAAFRLRASDFDSLLDSLREAGVSPVLRAAVLWRECSMDRRPTPERLQWIESRLRENRDSPLIDVLDTWEIRVRQGKYR